MTFYRFRDGKSQEEEIKAWQFWHQRQHSVSEARRQGHRGPVCHDNYQLSVINDQLTKKENVVSLVLRDPGQPISLTTVKVQLASDARFGLIVRLVSGPGLDTNQLIILADNSILSSRIS